MKLMIFGLVVAALSLHAEELAVGPGEKFATIEAAVEAAKAGDVVLVKAASLSGVAVRVDTPKLTIRGVLAGGKRVAVSGKGFDYSGRGFIPRAVFQFNKGADGCVLEGFEISGAHNDSHNGAGVRINQANDVTVRNCDIHGNDMGIMSNGDGTLEFGKNQLIADCTIHRNGSKEQPGYNHNLYLGGASVKLTNCDISFSLTGHNVKSRAHRIEVRNCKVHDSANREFDLVNAAETAFPGSDAVLVNNVITKGTHYPGNRGVIHFGSEGDKPHDGTLVMEGNTIRTPFITPVVTLSATQARVVMNNNVFENSGSQKSGQVLVDAKASKAEKPVSGSDNMIASSFSDSPGLTDTKTAK